MRHETFDTPGPLRIRVESASGSIELETTDGAKTEVELDGPAEHVEEAQVELRERGDGHELVVKTNPRSGFRLFRLNGKGIDVRIRAPHGATVEISSASADVAGRGRYGRVEVNSASGDVTFEEIEGDAAGQHRVRRRRDRPPRWIRKGPTRPPATSRSERRTARLKVQTASGDQQIGSVAIWRSHAADRLG